MTDALPSAGELVRAFGPAKKSFGQCFLVDPSILGRLVEAADLAPGAPVVEIGPGPGGLTRTLLAAGHPVLAVDLDRRAIEHLASALPSALLTLHEGDAADLPAALVRDHAGESGSLALLGNLPYNVATKIFFHVEAMPSIHRMILMFQQEVADRFGAAVGTDDYGPLALTSRIRWSPRVVQRLPPGAFIPRPKVHSAALRFDRLGIPAVAPEHEERFRTLVRTAFQQRRKTMRNALRGLIDEPALEAAGIDPGLRPERVSFDAFHALARA